MSREETPVEGSADWPSAQLSADAVQVASVATWNLGIPTTARLLLGSSVWEWGDEDGEPGRPLEDRAALGAQPQQETLPHAPEETCNWWLLKWGNRVVFAIDATLTFCRISVDSAYIQ